MPERIVQLPDGKQIVVPADPTPEQEAAINAAVAPYKALMEDGALHFYNADPGRRHARQWEFHSAHPPEPVQPFVRAFLGGLQSGKTTGGLADDVLQCIQAEAVPPHLRAFRRRRNEGSPFRCRIFTPDLTKTGEGSLVEKLKELVPKSQLKGGSWRKAYVTRPAAKLTFADGSWIDFMSYEQDMDKFGSITLDRVHFDEEPPGEKGRQIYLQARARVMARQGDIIFTMTPEFGMSWMYDDIWEHREDPDVFCVVVQTDENVYLDPKAIAGTFAAYTDEEQEYKRKGRFIAFGGLVLKLDPDRHYVQATTREHVRNLAATYRIIDPGADQGAVLWVGFDKDDVMLVFDELYPKGDECLVPNLAKQIREKDAYWGIQPFELIDPSSRNRTQGSDNTSVQEAFWAEGLYPDKAKNNRFHSVMQLRRRAASDPPGIVVVRENCPKFIWEANRWRVAADESSDQVKRGNTGDTFATTGPDHLMDCVRYAALAWLWGPEDPTISTDEEFHWTPGQAAPASVLNRPEPATML